MDANKLDELDKVQVVTSRELKNLLQDQLPKPAFQDSMAIKTLLADKNAHYHPPEVGADLEYDEQETPRPEVEEVTIARLEFVDKSSPDTEEVVLSFQDNLHAKNNRLYAQIRLHEKDLLLQLDSAADKSILTVADHDALHKIDHEPTINDTVLRDVQGNVINQPREPVLLNMNIAGKMVQHPFYVIDTKQSLLGADFMAKHKMSTFYTKDKDTPYFTLGGLGASNVKRVYHGGRIEATRYKPELYAPEDFVLFPGSNEVELRADIPDGTYEIKAIDSPLKCDSVTVNNGVGKANIANMSPQPIEAQATQLIAEADLDAPADAFPPLPESDDYDVPEIVEPLGLPADITLHKWEEKIMNQDHVPLEYREQIIHLLKHKSPEVLSLHDLDVGTLKPPYDKIKHEIKLTDDKPVRMQPYKLNPLRAAQLENIIQRLVDHGFLIKAESPYGMSCFLIKRKMGDSKSGDEAKLRLISDGRGINKKTVPEVFPFHDPTEIFADIAYAQPRVFTSLDLALAFNHIEMTPEAMKAAAIVVPGGCYLPTRMTFGLKCAPSSFNYLMSKISENFPRRQMPDGTWRKICVHYADDCLIFSRDMASHLADIEAVLRVFAEAGIKLDIGKTKLFRSEVEFVGRRIDAFGVSPLQKHLNAIERFPSPRNQRDVMSFLGLTLWVSPSIPQYTKKVGSLLQLLKKDVLFSWDSEREDDFKKLKADLSKMTKLYHIDYSAPLYCCTDASNLFHSYFCYQIKSYTRDELDKLGEEFKFADMFSAKAPSTKHPILLPSTKQAPGLKYLTPVEDIENIMSLEEAQAKSQELKISNVALGKLQKELPLEAFLSETDMLHFIMPVAYGSHAFNKAARNWHTLEKEAYGLVFAAKDLTSLVLSTRGVLYMITDSSPLTWLVQTTSLARGQPTKLTRWLISLYECPFTMLITHTKGMDNLVADGLSRPYSIAWKVVSTADGLTPVTVATPFPVGSVVSLEDLQNYIKRRLDKGEIVLSEREHGPNRYITKVNTAYVKEITAKVVNKLKASLSDDELIKHQAADEEIQKLLKNKNFYKHAGLIYKRRVGQVIDDDSGRPCLPKTLIGPALALNHFRNHLGANQLARRVAEQFYYPFLKEKSLKFTTQCYLCGLTKSNFKGATTIKVESFAHSPKLATWSIDVLVGLAGPDKVCEILVCVEMATKFKLLFPSPPNKSFTADRVATLLEERLFTVFTPPATMTSDGGSPLLISKRVSELLIKYDVQRHIGLPYHPRGHGTVERSNSTLITLFKSLVRQTAMPFNSLIANSQLILNTTPSSVLGGFTPQHYMMGVNNAPGRPEGVKPTDLVSANTLTQEWRALEEEIRKHVQKYRAKQQKERERRGGYEPAFEEGQFVYHKDHTYKAKPKIHAKYHMLPARITRVLDSALIVETFDGRAPRLPKDQCKLCPEREAELFANLPLEVQMDLGEPFSYEDLSKHMDEGSIPPFYKEHVESYDGPAMGTRSRRIEEQRQREKEEQQALREERLRQKQLAEAAEADQQPQDDDDSDEDEDSNDKRVTFDLAEDPLQ